MQYQLIQALGTGTNGVFGELYSGYWNDTGGAGTFQFRKNDVVLTPDDVKNLNSRAARFALSLYWPETAGSTAAVPHSQVLFNCGIPSATATIANSTLTFEFYVPCALLPPDPLDNDDVYALLHKIEIRRDPGVKSFKLIFTQQYTDGATSLTPSKVYTPFKNFTEAPPIVFSGSSPEWSKSWLGEKLGGVDHGAKDVLLSLVQVDAKVFVEGFQRQCLKANGKLTMPAAAKSITLNQGDTKKLTFTQTAVNAIAKLPLKRCDLPWSFVIENFPVGPVLDWYNAAICTPYLESLTRVKDASPLSVLPTLSKDNIAAASPTFKASYLWDGVGPNGVEGFKQPTISPNLDPDVTIVLNGTLDNFCDHFGNALKVRVGIRTNAEAPSDGSKRGLFPVKMWLQGTDPSQAVRIGAFDILPDTDLVTDMRNADFGTVTVTSRRDRSQQLGVVLEDITVPVAGFAPAGVDDLASDAFTLEDDTREFPLVIIPTSVRPPDDQRFSWTTGVNFAMVVREQCGFGATQSYQIALKVARGQSTFTLPTRRVLYLSSQPSLIAAVDTAQIVIYPDRQSLIALLDSTSPLGPVWQFIQSQDPARVTMQPQAIGEAMEKAKLPVHDVDEGLAADFRFSPNAELLLRSTYFFAQQLGPVPWDLNTILGDPGSRERDPGAALMGARFELLYGLTCLLGDVGLRLALLEARLGAIPDSRPSSRIAPLASDILDRAYKAAQDNWKKRQKQYSSRLAVLIPGPPPPVRLVPDETPVVIDTDISYTVRSKASRAYPFPAELIDPNIQPPTINGFTHTWDGLAGSLPQAFDSKNEYTALLESPTSLAGSELARPAFTALGGYGRQKAVYEGGNLIIRSTTEMGRLQFLSVEKIVKIGQSGNRSKHVVIYERTVTATLQFRDQQDHLFGRPALRKVKEYLEILEPRKPQGNPKMARFCEAVTFETLRMNVDSAWGEDVGTTAWKAPIWRDYSPLLDVPVDPQMAKDQFGLWLLMFNSLNNPNGSPAQQANRAVLRQYLADNFYDSFATEAPRLDTFLFGVVNTIPQTLQDRFNSYFIDASVDPHSIQPSNAIEMREVIESIANTVNTNLNDPSAPVLVEAITNNVPLEADTVEFLARHHRVPLVGEELARLQRMVLEDAYPGLVPRSLARVYPKPTVVVELTAARNEAVKTTQCSIVDVQKMVFATLTSNSASTNTDEWPPIRDVDYLDLPEMQPPAYPHGDPSDLDRKVPSPYQYEGGYGSMTWTLAGQPHNVDLLAGCTVAATTDRPSSLIRNITLVRSVPKPTQPTIGGDIGAAYLASLSFPADILDALHKALDLLPTNATTIPADIQALVAPYIHADPPTNPALKSIIKAGIWRPMQTSGTPPITGVYDELIAKAHAALTASQNGIYGAIAAMKAAIDAEATVVANQVKTDTVLADEYVDSVFNRAGASITPLTTGIETLANNLELAIRTVKSAASRARVDIDILKSRVDALFAEAKHDITLVVAPWRQLSDDIAAWESRSIAALDSASAVAGSVTQGTLGQVAETISEEIKTVRSAIVENCSLLVDKIDEITTKIHDATDPLLDDANAFIDAKLKTLEDAIDQIANLTIGGVNDFLGGVKDVEASLATFVGALATARGVAHAAVAAAGAVPFDMAAICKSALDGFQVSIDVLVGDNTSNPKTGLHLKIDQLGNALKMLLIDEAKQLANYLKTIGLEIMPASVDDARKAFQNAIRCVEHDFSAIDQRLRKELKNALPPTVEDVFQQATRESSNLIRAIVDFPAASGLAGNRDQIALYLTKLEQVLTTPAIALANRIGDDIKANSLRIPFNGLGDAFNLDVTKLKLSDLLPHIAGLSCDGLFPGITVPASAADHIKVTKGVDPKQKSAWLKVKADFDLDGAPATLFSIGPMAVTVAKVHFTAEVDIVASTSGATEASHGQVSGDWQVLFSGQPIVTFQDTALRFSEDGKLHFDLAADKVQVVAPLNFLSDLLQSIGFDDGGFSVYSIMAGSIPVGVEARLVLALPPLGAGLWAITGLTLSAYFRVLLTFGGSRGLDFVLATGFALGSKDEPFVLTAGIIGGGGYLQTDVEYHPLTGQTRAVCAIGIAGSASIQFSLGPISGGVGVDLVFSAMFVYQGGAGSLHILISLHIWGRAQALGFISISLSILLELEYGDGQLTGRGSVDIEVKICWCFTFSFSASMSYTIGGGGTQRSVSSSARASIQPPDTDSQSSDLDDAAQDHMDMLS